MLTKKLVLIAVILSFLVPPMSMLHAQDAGALLDLLVRKKLINDQEAEEVRAELTKEAATTSGGKWKLSTPLTERERYRLRLGLRGTLADDWFFGLRFETNASSRSTNVTFGDEATGGPFAKNSDTVNVGQAYLGYKGFHDITLTGGKMPNPLVTTLMVWDPDINPEGLAEQWKHTFTIGGGGAEATQSYSKEGKGVVATQAAAEPFKMTIDVFVNF